MAEHQLLWLPRCISVIKPIKLDPLAERKLDIPLAKMTCGVQWNYPVKVVVQPSGLNKQS